MQRPEQGRFISFEGIEGCGKTTQIALLSGYLQKHSIPHTITREPGGTAVGEGIRKILLNSETIHLTSASELLLFYASRSQNIQEKIRPALQRNEMVICDRYYHASMAYQGYGRGLPLAELQALHGFALGDFAPDLTLILDLPVAEGLARAAKRSGSADRFERLDPAFHERLRQGFQQIAAADPQRCAVIDASGDVDNVHLAVLAAVAARLDVALSPLSP